MSLFIVANTPGSEVGFDSQSCSLISVSDFPHPFTLLCLHTECWFLDDSLQLALLPWLMSQAAPSWVAHLGLRLRRLAIPEDGEQLFPHSSANVLKPSLAQRGARVHSEPVLGARAWIMLTDSRAHRTSLEPDGVRVLAPWISGAEGYLKHALSMG